MLKITIPAQEQYDEIKEEFFMLKEQVLSLEHSLVSISKWEAKWKKPFLSQTKKTDEETIDYIRCMTITQNVNPEVYKRLTNRNIREINEYIDDPMTATIFSDLKKGTGREIITSEIIYYQMIALNIPPEYQKWHLNRLIALINVCSIKNQPPKKRNRREIIERNAAINAARKRELNTRG